VCARRIPVQNLDKKQLDRCHGIEQTLPPPIGGATTGRQDGLGRKLTCPVLLKLFDDLGKCRWHWGSPLCVSERLTLRTGDRHRGQEGEVAVQLTAINESSYA
jgi:hypothetical protein